jgi:hypothetical protein
MNRGWMYTNLKSTFFVEGIIESIVNVTISYMDNNVLVHGYIHRPSKDCKNLKQWQNIEQIHCHLVHMGFMKNYIIWWIKHGEEGENLRDVMS